MIYLSDIPTPSSFIYLASPYSGYDFDRHVRYEYTKYAVAKLVEAHLAVFSPILNFHDLAQSYRLPTDATYWDLVNSAFVQQCSELWVLMLEGWAESAGIKLEREYAEALEKPVRFCYFDAKWQLLIMEGDKVETNE